MTVNFYSFSKKKNSTAQPVSNPTMYVCTLKEGCSVVSPTIGLDLGRLTSPSSFNYAYIPDFSRYYYIKDWYWEQGLWWANLSVDVLASHKADILSSRAYVLRSSKTYDGNIIDTFYPAKPTFTDNISVWRDNNTAGPWKATITNGVYVVGIINDDSTSIGAVSYYIFTPQQFATFKNILLHDANWTDIETSNPDIGINLYKSLFNPFQYIVSVKWFPIHIDDLTGIVSSLTELDFGWWNIPVIACYRLTLFSWRTTKTLEFTPHALAATRGNYLNSAPYSKYILYLTPFGEIELDANLFSTAKYTDNKGSLLCDIIVDLITGDATIRCSVLEVSSSTVEVSRLSTMLAVNINVAQIYSENNIDKMVETGTNGIIQMGKTFANAVSNTIDALIGGTDFSKTEHDISSLGVERGFVTDALSIGTVHLSQLGSNGSLAQFGLPNFLISRHMDIVDDDNSDFGRPICINDVLSAFSPGYVQTLNAHIISDCYGGELTAINTYMDGGVYLE